MKKYLLLASLTLTLMLAIPAFAGTPMTGTDCQVVDTTQQIICTGYFNSTTVKTTLTYWDGTGNWELTEPTSGSTYTTTCVGNFNTTSNGCGNGYNFAKIWAYADWTVWVEVVHGQSQRGNGYDSVFIKFSNYQASPAKPDYYRFDFAPLMTYQYLGHGY